MSEKSVKNGEVWKDTDGNVISAHGGGICKAGRKYYWYGEYRGLEPSGNDGFCPQVPGVSCYSSEDLVTWKFEGLALKRPSEDLEHHDLSNKNIIERPKVIYNETTEKFVMWMHIDSQDYRLAHAGVAVSDSPTGPFEYIRSYAPGGDQSRDMTVFKDEDGKAYIYYSTDVNATMHIRKLSDDYITPSDDFVSAFNGQYREAPIVFKREDKYHIITSGCSGWDPNAAMHAVADSPVGPWEEKGNPFVGYNSNRTFDSQGAHFIEHNGKVVYMGDKWNKHDLPDSRYLWLTLDFFGDKIFTPYREKFVVPEIEKSKIKDDLKLALG